MTKRVFVIATGIMSTLLVLEALWQFRIVMVYVLISLLVAAAFQPTPRSQWMRPRLTRIQLILRYFAGVALFLMLLYLAGRFLANDFEQFVEDLTEQSTWLLPAWLHGSAAEPFLSRWLPTPNQLLAALTAQRDVVLSAFLGFTQGLGGALSGLLIIIFLSVYWSFNQNHFERLWLSLLPAPIRKRARFISRAIEFDLGAYTRSEVMQSGLAVILLGLGYWLIGSPYPMLLAMTGALARLLPVIGSTLALILPFLLGSLTSTSLGVFSTLFTALVLVFLQVWVEPRFFRPNQDNPVLTFVILLAMADAFGLLGIVAAPPLSVICQTLWRFLVAERTMADTSTQVAGLKERHARLQSTIDEIVDVPPPLVVSSMQRLAGLLEKAEPILDGNKQEEPPTILRVP